MKFVTLDVIKLLNEYKGAFKNVIIDKSWLYGPSLKLQVNAGNDEDVAAKRDELFSRIKNEVSKREDKNEKVDYQKHELISRKLSLIENYKGTILPLRNNYTAIEEKMNIEDIKTIYDKNLYIDIKSSISEFLCDSYEYFFDLDEEDKDTYLMKLMIILAHYNPPEIKNSQGIKYAYLTYRSHYEGFNKQLRDNSKSKEAMMSMVNNKPRKVKNFEQEQFDNLLESIETKFINYKEKDRTQILKWFGLVKDLLNKFKDALETGKVKFQDYHDIEFYLSNHKDLSEFHKNLAANPKLKDVLRSETILRFRLCVNTLYSMLPLISVSPLKKHVLCKYVCDAVEGYYKMNYISIMQEKTESI